MSRRATLALALVTAGCASAGLAGPPVDGTSIDQRLRTPPFDQMHVGVLAVDLQSGDTVYEHEAHRKFIPASNQKILVTAAALSLLGPDFRFRTEAWLEGRAAGVEGQGSEDLVIVASGDPSFSSRYWSSGTEALDAIADSVRAAGIARIAGSAIVDVSAWDSTTVGPTWEVEDMLYTYGSTGGAFAVDDGEIEIVVTAGAAIGAPAQVTWVPQGTDDFVLSRVTTVAADSSTRVRPHYLPESRRLALDGVVAAGTVDTVSFAIRDPVRQAVAALARAFGREGIEVADGWDIRWDRAEGDACAAVPWADTTTESTAAAGTLAAAGSVEGDGSADPAEAGLSTSDCTPARRLFAMESPPLGDLVAGILEPSQNWMTEQLVHALGERFGTEGSWEEGMGVVVDYLVDEVGVTASDLAVRDGSGRSAYNLVTPRALVLVLEAMRAGPHGDRYRDAMAEPGEKESTLEDRMLDLDGQVFAKTGSISNVNSLSGYLVRRDGREIAFSILTNGSGVSASRVRGAIDEIVRTLAR